jgi:DNA-directed RNA polymerase subunit K
VNYVKQFGYTRFERARIIGARALQITMGAPILINVPKEEIDPITISTIEFEKGAIPITVMRDDQIIPRGAAR